jgi:sulfur carrier protein
VEQAPLHKAAAIRRTPNFYGDFMNLIVNGEKYEHCGDGTVPALLAELGAEPGHTALTVNGDLVFSKDWNIFKLTDGDAVEVLTFVGGG